MNKTTILLFIIILGIINIGALTDSLTVYYTMDDDDVSGSTAIDSVGNYNGTLEAQAASGSTGIIGEAIDLDGDTDDVDTTIPVGSIETGDDWSVCMWFYADTNTADSDALFGCLDGSNNGVTHTENGGNYKYWTGAFYDSGVAFDTEEWVFTCTVHDGGANINRFYRNGVSRYNYTDGYNACTETVAIGRMYGEAYPEHSLNGRVDEFGFWEKELTGAEITELYNSGFGCQYPFTNCVAGLAPIIDNSTYNFSSAASGENTTGWRDGNEDYQIRTVDSTPTVRFDTVASAYCRINTVDQNWSTMGGSRNCTTTGSTSHVCTLPAGDALSLGDSLLYLGCIDATFTNETPLSTSGGLNVSYVSQVNLNTGILDEDFSVVNNNVTAGFEWYAFANYTYASNNTAIYPGGECNWTATNISQESSHVNLGTNYSVCSSGCDYTTRYKTIGEGLDVSNYIEDQFTLRFCRQGSAGVNAATISMNCTGVSDEVIPFSSLPICSAGYVNYTFVRDCNNQQSIQVNVTSDVGVPSRALVVVDDYFYVDRFHNMSEVMVFNASNNLFVSSHLHETYDNVTLNFSCNSSVALSGFNETDLVVGNQAPIVIIEEVWWWLLSDYTLLTNGLSAKYPLQSTLNFTALVVDNNGNLDNVSAFLNYSNGTNIFSCSDGSPGTCEDIVSVNYTRFNFSTNGSYLDGVLGYVWQVIAFDTDGVSGEASRSFTVENERPSITMGFSGDLSVANTPYNVTWSCVDPEGEVNPTTYLFLNGTLNDSFTNQFWLFNFSEGDYDINLSCNDTFRNSTNTSFLLSFVQSCVPVVTSPCAGCRYRDNNVPLVFSCAAGTLDSCYYQIDDYEPVYPSNCSNFNITAELGRNHFVLWTNSTGGAEERVVFDFYAKKLDGVTFADYSVLFIMCGLVALLFLARMFTKVPFFGVIAGLGVVWLSVELWAFDYWLGIFAAGCGVVFFVWSIYDGLR